MRGFAGATLSWAGAFPPHRGSDHGQRPEKVEQGNPQAQEGRAAQGERVEPIDQRQARSDDDDQDLVAVGGAAAFTGPSRAGKRRRSSRGARRIGRGRGFWAVTNRESVV